MVGGVGTSPLHRATLEWLGPGPAQPISKVDWKLEPLAPYYHCPHSQLLVQIRTPNLEGPGPAAAAFLAAFTSSSYSAHKQAQQAQHAPHSGSAASSLAIAAELRHHDTELVQA